MMEIGIKDRSRRLEISLGRYIGHTKRNLKLFGMWKFESGLPKWKTLLVTFYTIVFLTCNLLLGLSELAQLQNAADLPEVASGIGDFWFHLLGFFKWFYFVWKGSNVASLIQDLEECYDLSLGMSHSDEGSSRLREEMTMAKKSSIKFTYVWTIFMMYGVVHWCVNPLLLQFSVGRSNFSSSEIGRPLPYQAWIPWDTRETSGYWYAYFFEFVGSFAGCIGHISFDVFYMTLVMMICAQFRFLNYSLADSSSGTSKKLTYSFLKTKLTRSKIYHNAILKFLESLEKVTSPVMFVECIGTIGILCLVSFEATTMELKGDMKNTIRVWSMLEYILGGFTQLFAFCYSANKVTTLGLKVADSAYNCGWESLKNDKDNPGDYEEMKKERRIVGFLTHEILTRAQKPVKLTGGPFYVLSLETYRAVVSAAFSYSAVLREFGGD